MRQNQSPWADYWGSRVLQLTSPIMQGWDVLILQNLLNLLPQYIAFPAPECNGTFDLPTANALKSMQRYFNIPANGTVNGETFFHLGHITGSYNGWQPVFTSRPLELGQEGPDVTVLQNRLSAGRKPLLNRPSSGKFDLATHTALYQLQQDFNLESIPGIADRKTLFYVIIWFPLGGRNLFRGRNGLDTCYLQQYLSELGYYQDDINGYFDSTTSMAVRQFQTDAAIKADGIVGPQTLLALGSSLTFPSFKHHYYIDSKESASDLAHILGPQTFNFNAEKTSKPLRPGRYIRLKPPLSFCITQKGDTFSKLAAAYNIACNDCIKVNREIPNTAMPEGISILLPHQAETAAASSKNNIWIKNMPSVSSSTTIIQNSPNTLNKARLNKKIEQAVSHLPGEKINGYSLSPDHHKIFLFASSPSRNSTTIVMDLLTGSWQDIGINHCFGLWDSRSRQIILLGQEYYGDYYPWFYYSLLIYDLALNRITTLFRLKSIDLNSIRWTADSSSIYFHLTSPRQYYPLPEYNEYLYCLDLNGKLLTWLK